MRVGVTIIMNVSGCIIVAIGIINTDAGQVLGLINAFEVHIFIHRAVSQYKTIFVPIFRSIYYLRFTDIFTVKIQ